MKVKLFDKFLTNPKKLTRDEIIELEMDGYEEPERPRYPHGCVVHLILDDLVGSSAFRPTGRSALTNLVLKNRHLGVNILIASQSLKSIPKAIRLNTSLFVLLKYANLKMILDDLHEEVSNIITMDEFIKLYKYATSNEHDALVVDQSQPKEQRIKKNFDVVLNIN